MMRIIGLGSPFDDDNIGWRCLQALQAELEKLAAHVEIIYCATPGTQLIHLLQADTPTILVDALLSEQQTARVHHLQLDQLQQPEALSSHQISVAAILQLAASLGRLPQQLHILGIGIQPQQRLDAQQFARLQEDLRQHISTLVIG